MAKWTTMRRASFVPLTEAQIEAHARDIMKTMGPVTFEAAKQAVRDMAGDEEKGLIFQNDRYTCIVRKRADFVHLSMRRNDRRDDIPWRHMQKIKNDILGPEAECVELFPAESRLVDTANQRHLWAPADGAKFAFGFNTRAVTSQVDPASGAVQTPLED